MPENLPPNKEIPTLEKLQEAYMIDAGVVNCRGTLYKKHQVADWTLRNYYSHDGPGWDFRFPVLEHFKINDPSALPDTPLYYWKEISE